MAIARVQVTGNSANSSTTVVKAFVSNVTAGNTIIVGVSSNVNCPLASGVTKSGGTATIGTVTRDIYAAVSGSSPSCAIYSIPITGTGSCTITVTLSSGYHVLAIAEYSGVLDTSPCETTAAGTIGADTTEETNNLVGTLSTLYLYQFAENVGDNFTRSYTNSFVGAFEVNTAASTMAGALAELITTPGTRSTVCTKTGAAADWTSVGAAYKPTPAGGEEPLTIYMVE